MVFRVPFIGSGCIYEGKISGATEAAMWAQLIHRGAYVRSWLLMALPVTYSEYIVALCFLLIE